MVAKGTVCVGPFITAAGAEWTRNGVTAAAAAAAAAAGGVTAAAVTAGATGGEVCGGSLLPCVAWFGAVGVW